MPKKLLLLLGNGFTIDLINHIQKTVMTAKDVDVSNFFKFGAEVPWPANNEPGFLSFKHCPNLWNLGARPNMENQAAYDLIEDIITTVNVYASHPKKSNLDSTNQNDIYFYAYKELTAYLRSLFVYYDSKVGIEGNLLEWAWADYFTKIVEHGIYSQINIVTYNYDIWLERLLTNLGIPFSINGFGESEGHIQIFKPHGSISFKYGVEQDQTSYKIKYTKDMSDEPIEKFRVEYDDLEKYYILNAMIPPAGDARRMEQSEQSWSTMIHSNIIQIVKEMNENDDCIICGLSYWHVDRNELDQIIVNCDSKINMKMINPNPPRSFTAVLTSLFRNLVIYPNANILKGLH